MHAISFFAKRLHLCATAYGRQLFHEVFKVRGMTPARFDILCLMREPGIALQESVGKRPRRGPWPGSDQAVMKQRTIVERLGLHPSTISKMIKRLREMGWVTVARDVEDRRVKVVEATPLGMRRIWEAMRRLFRERWMLRQFEVCHRWIRPGVHVLDALDNTIELLWELAHFMGDSSDHTYDWGSRNPRFD